MARVRIASQPWGVDLDSSGNVQVGKTATFTDLNGNAATVYAAATGSTTAAATTNSRGEIAGWIEEGSYLLSLVDLANVQVEATSGATATGVGFVSSSIYTDPIQGPIDACSAAGGGKVVLPAGGFTVSAAKTIPNFVNVVGHGQSTVVTCTGNHYAFSFTGSRCSLSNLRIEKSGGTQSSGGGVDYTSAGSDVWLEDIYFGQDLHTSVNAAPTGGTRSVYKFRRLRWLFAAGNNTAIKLGDGTNLLTDVDIDSVTGTGGSTGGMVTWLDAARLVDTLKINQTTFYQGTNGVILGSRGASGNVTGLQASRFVVDAMSGIAIDAANTLDAVFDSSCMIQTCGSSTAPGLKVQSTVKVFDYHGRIRNCVGHGAVIQASSKYVGLHGAIYDNNTGNTAGLVGVSVEANATDFVIDGRFIGNGLLGSGHQKYGVDIASGSSDKFRVDSNFASNETAAYRDQSTGIHKEIVDRTAGTRTISGQINAIVLGTGSKAGTPSDADTYAALSGNMMVDTTNSKLYVRVGSTWKSVTLA